VPNPVIAPETIVVLADLFQQQLDLPADRVFIYNQKWKIPPDDDIFIVVSLLTMKPYGSYRRQADDPLFGLIEVIGTNLQETYTVDIFSRNGMARVRRLELLFALQSTQAQQLSEDNSFRLATVPPVFVDLSGLEGSAILNRYQLTFSLLRAEERKRAIEYFDTFENPPKTLITNP
jgi:hypothetical protein